MKRPLSMRWFRNGLRVRGVLGMAALAVCMARGARAEQLTVHVVDAETGRPVSGIVVQLTPNPCEQGKHKATELKSNRDGVATFGDINLTAVPWAVSVYSVGYEQQDAVQYIASPEIAKSTTCSNTVVSAFPADITLHLRRRGWWERLEYLVHSV